MTNSKTKERIHTVVFMLIVTAICITIVSGTYLSLKDIIDRNQQLFVRKAILGAAGLSVPDSALEVENLYIDCVTEIAVTNSSDASVEQIYFVRDEQSGQRSMVLKESGAGLWGTIHAVVGFAPGGTPLTGVRFTEQNETPGLGARIEEEGFKAQFPGKCGPFSMLPEGSTTGTNQFDAITGATITSTAVRDILNRACERAERNAAEQLLQGGSDGTQ